MSGVGKRSSAIIGAVALAAFMATAGCGSSSDTAAQQLAKQKQLQHAREQAAKQQKLQDKLKALQKQVNGQNGAGTTTAGAPSPPATSAGSQSCGGDLSVGPNTSCEFAQNVRAAYQGSGGGNVIVSAYSPVTSTTYEMACGSTGGTVVCTGGNNASVFFP
jgi:hypothetical protein